jgi:DNA polymerase-3 subunit alpha
MFDLWGEAMPVPMPSLDLENADISVRDRLVWEKELMGVYLSEHPFSSVASEVASGDTTLCGQIDAELVGQTVIVAGMVASVRHLFTRDRRPFVSAILEDLDGQIEAMVWPKVYTDTGDLWEEGNILLVEGKVRLRDDRVQLSCDKVRRYQPTVPDEEIIPSPPEEEPVVAEETTASTTPAESRRLVISLSQTSDEETDKANLHKLIDALRDFPGQDAVKLSVTNGERVINLRLSSIYTNYCPELRQRLVELVGEDGLRLETKALKKS